MNTKQIISLAIIATLPCAANATGPAHDSGNSPVVATASAPYQTVTPEAHADEHIASTKYVIGAYNDAIAAVNKVNDDKQGQLVLFETGNNLSTNVLGGAVMGDVGIYVGTGDTDGIYGMRHHPDLNMTNSLVSADGVLEGMIALADKIDEKKQDQLVTSSGGSVDTELATTGEIPNIMRTAGDNNVLTDVVSSGDFANKLMLADDVIGAIGILRVPVYTAWDADTVTKVGLAVAVNAQE